MEDCVGIAGTLSWMIQMEGGWKLGHESSCQWGFGWRRWGDMKWRQ